MRLYVVIERNALPSIKTIWPVSDNQTSTIAQLLASINATIPLESGQWGLEDYVVTVGGFECLHYHEIAKICKDGDELVIRPLQTAELHARTLGGRHQISGGGRHLIDGVAFGKPALKGSDRPDVHIPARKRRKIDASEEEAVDAETAFTEQNDSDNSDSDPSDYEDSSDEVSDSSLSQSTSDSDSIESDREEQESSSISSSDSDSDDTSDSDSEDLPQPQLSLQERKAARILYDSDDDAPHNDCLSDSDSDMLSDGSSWPGFEAVEARIVEQERRKLVSHANPVAQANPRLLETTLSANQALKEEFEQRNEELIAMGREPRKSMPHHGSGETQRRNARRKMAKRRNYLISEGALPSWASNEDLREYEARVADGRTASTEGAEEEMAVDAVDEDAPPEVMSSRRVDTVESTKRPRLDVSSARNFILRPLGLTRSAASTEMPPALPPAPIKPNDLPSQERVEDWSSKINLRAVECVDEGVKLATPPFPFHQNWDPQYPPVVKSKGKRKHHEMEHDGAQKYGLTDTGDFLDYDGEYWEEGALLNAEAFEEQNDNSHLQDEFPDLPANVEGLPIIDIEGASKGDFIILSVLDVSAATNWQPAMVNRTVKLLSKVDDGWNVRVADRDLPSRQMDENGDRVYTKFEMAADEDYDTAEKLMEWDEFGAATIRLLSRQE